MTDRDRRRSPPQVLTVLAGAAVLAHFYGLYRVTGPPTLSWFPHADKVEHLVGFAAPLWLVLQARRAAVGRCASLTPAGTGGLSRRFVVGVTGAFVLNAVVSELAQYAFYVHRTGDPFDALADLLGVVLGLALTQLWVRRHPATGSGQVQAAAPADSTGSPRPSESPRPIESP